MAGFGELLGQPLVSGALNLITSILQQQGAAGRRPAPYQPSTNRGGSTNLPQGIRGNLQPGEFQRFFGGGGSGGASARGPRGVSVPTPGLLNLNNVMGAQIQDEINIARRGDTRDARLQPIISDYRASLARSDQRLGQASDQAQQGLAEGRAGFNNARSAQAGALAGVGSAEDATRANAAAAIQTTAGLVQDFKNQSRALMDNLTTMRGDVLAEAKNSTAVLLADASQSVKNTTDQQMSDVISEMRAMGVPEAQIQGQVAQISAQGQQQIGDMLRDIGVAENARLSALQVETGNWISNLSQTSLSAFGGVTTTAIGETARTLSGAADNLTRLAESRAGIARTIAGLETSAADWQGSQNRAIADIEATRSRMVLGGQVDLANLVSSLEDSLVMLGPIFETSFSASMGLEEAEYNYAMQNYNVQNAEESIFYNSIYDNLNYYRQYADARHAQRYNQRNFNRSFATAWIPTAAGTASGVAGVLDEPTTTPSEGGPTTFGSLGEGNGQSYYNAYNPY